MVILRVTCILILCLTGCATLEKIGLLNVVDPKPVWGPPETTGMVIIECRVFTDPAGNLLEPGKIIGQELKEAIFGRQEADWVNGKLTDSLGNQIEGGVYGVDWSGAEMLIIFPELQPGRYRLSQLNAVFRHYDDDKKEWYKSPSTIDIPSDALEELTFNILPGKTVYIGQFEVIESGRDKSFNINDSTKYEIEAFKKVIKKYKKSPWVSRWQKHLKGLENDLEK